MARPEGFIRMGDVPLKAMRRFYIHAAPGSLGEFRNGGSRSPELFGVLPGRLEPDSPLLVALKGISPCHRETPHVSHQEDAIESSVVLLCIVPPGKPVPVYVSRADVECLTARIRQQGGIMNISPEGVCIGGARVRPGATEHRCQCRREKAPTPAEAAQLRRLETEVNDLDRAARKAFGLPAERLTPMQRVRLSAIERQAAELLADARRLYA